MTTARAPPLRSLPAPTRPTQDAWNGAAGPALSSRRSSVVGEEWTPGRRGREMLNPPASQMSQFHQHSDHRPHASSPVMRILRRPCWLGLLPPGFPFFLPFPAPGETERGCMALLGRGQLPCWNTRRPLPWTGHSSLGRVHLLSLHRGSGTTQGMSRGGWWVMYSGQGCSLNKDSTFNWGIREFPADEQEQRRLTAKNELDLCVWTWKERQQCNSTGNRSLHHRKTMDYLPSPRPM